MSKTSFIVALVCSMGTTGAFAADTLKFVDPGTNIWWNSYISVYVSPYTATDITQGKSFSLYCVDFNHDIETNTVWTADVVPLTPAYASNLYYSGNVPATWGEYNVNLVSNSGFGTISMSLSGPPSNPTPFNRYLEAAYLFTQSQTAQADAAAHPGNAAADLILQQQYNIAAWTLFISQPPENIPAFVSAINSSNYGNAVYNDVQAAQTAVASGAFTGAGWYAVTPDPKTGTNLTQEFLTYRPVPEPAAVLLFGTFVGLLALIRTRRNQHA
jgi:hypothetical protein